MIWIGRRADCQRLSKNKNRQIIKVSNQISVSIMTNV